jgi:GntR family transcriptional regulator, transcriptional repressor for pyruvate dehydrogenase complex
MEIHKIKKRLIVQEVMEQMKNLIATRQFKPHDRIPTETELAEMFGTGRTTIREAVKVFQHLGILEPQPRKGTFVCDNTNVSTEALTWSILLGRHENFELIDLRYIIEKRSLEILLQNGKDGRSDDVLRILKEDIGKMKAAKADSSQEDLVQADYHFHGTIIRASGNNVYINIYLTLRSFMHEEIKKTSMDEAASSAAIEEHQAIVDAVESRSEKRTHEALKSHIRSTIQQLKSALGMDSE